MNDKSKYVELRNFMIDKLDQFLKCKITENLNFVLGNAKGIFDEACSELIANNEALREEFFKETRKLLMDSMCLKENMLQQIQLLDKKIQSLQTILDNAKLA